MFDYEKYFNQYCCENKLDLTLSFAMPAGYETADGTFDAASKTVFINAEYLKDAPDYEKAFYLFHELRHSLQFLCPEQFSRAIRRSLQYVIMYDGTCYKFVNGKYHRCKLEGDERYFTNIYLGQPYESDADRYAYTQAKNICGASDGLHKLLEFRTPSQPVSEDVYDSVYALIDGEIEMKD